MSAFNKQQGGNHYKNTAVQPLQLGYAVFNGDSCAVKVAKYLTREKEGWAVQIDKAEHILEMFSEVFIHSPIAQLSYAQELIMEQFVAQSPEPVREPLMEILSYMITLAAGEHSYSPEVVASSFDAIRSYRLSEYLAKKDKEEPELPEGLLQFLDGRFGVYGTIKPQEHVKTGCACGKGK